jgi:transcriptional regulator with XRE-family HTH domain
MLLAKRIKAIREHKGFTQKQVADKIGIEQATYSGYEREAGNLKFNTIVRIAEALNCSVPFLVDIYSDVVDGDKWEIKSL